MAIVNVKYAKRPSLYFLEYVDENKLNAILATNPEELDYDSVVDFYDVRTLRAARAALQQMATRGKVLIRRRVQMMRNKGSWDYSSELVGDRKEFEHDGKNETVTADGE